MKRLVPIFSLLTGMGIGAFISVATAPWTPLGIVMLIIYLLTYVIYIGNVGGDDD